MPYYSDGENPSDRKASFAVSRSEKRAVMDQRIWINGGATNIERRAIRSWDVRPSLQFFESGDIYQLAKLHEKRSYAIVHLLHTVCTHKFSTHSRNMLTAYR